MAQLAQPQGVLAGALGRFIAVAEAYPDLKASQNMQQLTEELTSTENKVAFARQAYNDSVLPTTTSARRSRRACSRACSTSPPPRSGRSR